MRAHDVRWRKNPEWYHREGLKIVIHDDAPSYVKESYENYRRQLKEEYQRSSK